MSRTIGAALGAILFVLFILKCIPRTPDSPTARPVTAHASAARVR
jgi:hypothetical protein